MQLKSKMAQLNVALDRAMHDQQTSRSRESIKQERIMTESSGPMFEPRSTPNSGFENFAVPPRNAVFGNTTQTELQKQLEINRRLNDLLNNKDEEIMRLSQQVMSLEDDNTRIRLSSPAKSSKKSNPLPENLNLVKGYGAVTALEHKFMDVTSQNKELQKEISILRRIQER